MIFPVVTIVNFAFILIFAIPTFHNLMPIDYFNHLLLLISELKILILKYRKFTIITPGVKRIDSNFSLGEGGILYLIPGEFKFFEA